MNLSELNIINETSAVVDESLLKACAEAVFAGEGTGQGNEVNLLICEDEAIRKYNRQYRGDDSVTDVLCFPWPDTLPADGAAESAEVCDIIIDIKQIDRQKGKKTKNQELMEVFIHGLLHACGYDHIRQPDQIAMSEKEIYYKRLMEGTLTRG